MSYRMAELTTKYTEMDKRTPIRAAQITLRRAILERFPPGDGAC
jgi:hypothetical protein